MEPLATVFLIFVGSVILAVWQGGLIRNLANCYSQPHPEWPSNRPHPKAAVILSLRGRDPFLSQCLRNLARQDYPDFQIYLIVDSETDPAWEAITPVLAEYNDRFLAATLSNRRPNCSLKNSSILQATQNLPANIEVVALVDADAIVPSSWLRNLIAPLAKEEIGCTTGIRWFAPAELSFGSRLRCYWNHIAASMIYASHIPWGGSMAIRRSVLDSGLTDEWSRMFCEDAHTINFLRRQGLGLVHVPEATIVNRENVSVISCIRFINRQMLIFRLYNRSWPWLVIATFLSAALRLTHDFLIVRSLWMHDLVSAALLIVCHPLILIVIRFEISRLDRIVRQTVQSQGQEIGKNPLPGIVGYISVEFAFLASVLTSLFTRFALWRGIRYRIRGPEDIKMLSYVPFALSPDSNLHGDSTVV